MTSKASLYFALTLLLTLSAGAAPTNQSPPHFKIVSLQKNFEDFWASARDKDFKNQLQLWDRLIENPYQGFYDSLVWAKTSTPDWPKRKESRLKDLFAEYPKLYAQIDSHFVHFESVLTEQIRKFKVNLPDARFDLPIYAVPAATFNGKAGPLQSTILAFGMDLIAERKDNPDILYSHELFHIYHSQKLKMTQSSYAHQAHFTLPLWLEGLAVFVSGKFNPTASDAEILMDPELARLNQKTLAWLALNFLKVSEGPAQDNKNPELYMKWFSTGEYQLNKALPSRCGYRLGLEVVRYLAKSYTLDEMVRWPLSEIHGHVLDALNFIGKERSEK